MRQGPAISATGICKAFGAVRAVDEANLCVDHGQLVALVGPSGSGKTTLLRTIAGFESPDAGQVEIGGRVVVGRDVWVEPEQRRVGMVFQHGALFPHLTVRANVGFGDASPGRVGECLDMVGLADRATAYPHELSGGEQQRIALARALAPDPDVILMDEPFAALDAGLRVTLREQVAAILREAGASALLVTHDQQEALSLADAVVVMRDGQVEQAGTPETLYAEPASPWLAQFLGDADIVRGVAHHGRVESELGVMPANPDLEGDVDVMVRPEWIALTSIETLDRSAGGASATVVSRLYFGHDQLVRLRLDNGREVRSRVSGVPRWRPGDHVCVRVDGPCVFFPAGRSGEPSCS